MACPYIIGVCHFGYQENKSAIASFAACRRRHGRLTLPSRKGAQTDTQLWTDAETQRVKKTKIKIIKRQIVKKS
jgi:hypothetical protein